MEVRRCHRICFFSDASVGIKVLEDTLRVSKDNSDGSDLSGITIRLTIAVEARGHVEAEDRQATDAVTSATRGLNSTPLAVGLLSSVVDAGTIVVEAQTFENTWGVLLQRLESFNNIVAGIAQVFASHYLDYFTI